MVEYPSDARFQERTNTEHHSAVSSVCTQVHAYRPVGIFCCGGIGAAGRGLLAVGRVLLPGLAFIVSGVHLVTPRAAIHVPGHTAEE